MNAIKVSMWNLFESVAKDLIKKNTDLSFDEGMKDKFDETFQVYYDKIKRECMSGDVTNLDAHKQAAIGAIAFSLLEPIKPKTKIDDEEVFIVNETYGLSVALSCMLDYLNTRLKDNNVNIKITSYIMPESINCNDTFFFIMCRTLYYNKKDNILDKTILNLSDIFFLIESYTLQKYGIDPKYLK